MSTQEKRCATCGAPFEAQRRTARYCSGSCRVRYSQHKRDVRAAFAFGLVLVLHE